MLVKMVIPTFNRCTMLEELLNRIYQVVDNKKFGVVVVDDCSSEENVRHLKLLQEKLPRVNFVFNNVNLGAPRSRNLGAFCGDSPEWLWFFDDDDQVSIEAIEKVIASAASAASGCGEDIILLSSRSVVNGEIKAIVPSGSSLYKRFRRYGHQVNTSCTIIKFDLFCRVGGWDPNLVAGQDTDLFLSLAKFTDAKVLEKVFVDVVVHSGERITTNPRKQMIAKVQFVKKHWNHLHPARTIRYLVALLIFYPYVRKCFKC